MLEATYGDERERERERENFWEAATVSGTKQF